MLKMFDCLAGIPYLFSVFYCCIPNYFFNNRRFTENKPWHTRIQDCSLGGGGGLGSTDRNNLRQMPNQLNRAALRDNLRHCTLTCDYCSHIVVGN